MLSWVSSHEDMIAEVIALLAQFINFLAVFVGCCERKDFVVDRWISIPLQIDWE